MSTEAHWVRAVKYLARFRSEELEFSAPWDLTQDGISAALGISRAHTTILLKRMSERGLVEGVLLHIQGGKRRRLAYRLTQQGVSVSRGKYF